MKLKRAIGAGVLTCCLAVMGVFSFGVRHAVAAVEPCDHTFLQAEMNAVYDSWSDSTSHYFVYGERLSCPRCGYVRWEGLYTEKSDHNYGVIGHDSYGNLIYSNECSVCGRKR